MGRMAGVSREADSEKIGHEEEIEMASRTYAFDYRQCLLGQPSRLTTDDDPVRADAMRRELLDYSFQFRGRAENLHPIGRAAEPLRVLVEQRYNPPVLARSGSQEFHKENRPVVHADQDHVRDGGSRPVRRAAVSFGNARQSPGSEKPGSQ